MAAWSSITALEVILLLSSKPSLTPIHIIDHLTEAPEEYESCMQSGLRHISAGIGSLFTIEPAKACPCSVGKAPFEQNKQNDETFMILCGCLKLHRITEPVEMLSFQELDSAPGQYDLCPYTLRTMKAFAQQWDCYSFYREEKIENTVEDGSLIVSPLPVSIHVLDHSTESPREHNTCMQSGGHNFSIGGHSLFIIEPAEECLCSKEKLSFQQEKQKGVTFVKQEEMETTKEKFDTTGIVRKYSISALDFILEKHK